MTQVSTAGAWRVHAGTVVTEEGVTQGTVIASGENEFFTEHTGEDLAPLIIALMDHLGISKVSSVSTPAQSHDHGDGLDHGHTH